MPAPFFPRHICGFLVFLSAALEPSHAEIVAPSSSPSSLNATQLRCEYLTNPLGIDVSQPRLSWILIGSKTTPRDMGQTAYHILVASTPEMLAQDQGDLWDSGEVESGETTNIPYAGSALKSRQACYWKVRTTDSTGRSTSWSAPAQWELGLLHPEDWKAQWLSAPTVVQIEKRPGTVEILQANYEAVDGAGGKDVTALVQAKLKDNSVVVPVTNDEMGGDPVLGHVKQLRVSYAIDHKKFEKTAGEADKLIIPEGRESLPYLRKDFTLGQQVVKARVYATALGLYELRLNGRRVGDHIFAPDWTDYSKRVRYQVYDVTSLVRVGANTLAGMVGNGWYSGHIGNGGFQAWGTVPALFAQMEVTYADGSTDRIVTDSSWKMHGSPLVSSDFMLGENYDARQEIRDWDRPGLNTADWTNASVRSEPPRALNSQVDQPVRQTAELHPKAMTEPIPGHWTYDLGQNMVGFVRLKLSAAAGTKVTLRHAEMLKSDGTVYTANLRGAPSVDTYICKGAGVETWQPRFTSHGFRYVELTGLSKPPDQDSVTGIVIGTDIPRTGIFTCSNPDVNQLQSNIQWGMRGNYFAVPTDCPQRDERMGWMGDAQIFVRTAAYNGDIAAFFTKWLVDVDDAQSQAGVFTDVSPWPYRSSPSSGVPAWADAGVICPWTIYLMYGDKRILQQHLPAMTRWVDWCLAHSTNFIRDHDRGNDYGDWLSQGENTQKDLIGTAYFAYSTSLLAQAYQATGNDPLAAQYRRLFDQIKAAFVQRYVGPDGQIKDATQSDYCMALKFHLLPDELRSRAVQYLEDDVKAHHDHLTTGFIGVSYLLPSLCSGNAVDTAYRVFLQDSFPSWLFSVKHGATTIWERWDGWTPEKGFQDPGMNSFNHYSLGSCGEWMFDTVAGIGVDAAQPGFRHIIIHPRPGGTLTQAEGSFDSIHGKISTRWQIRNGLFSLEVTIPINTTATIDLPTLDSADVKESGSALIHHPEIHSLPGEEGHALLSVGSGSYHFSCPAH